VLVIFDTLDRQYQAQRNRHVGRVGTGGSLGKLTGDVAPCCPVPPIGRQVRIRSRTSESVLIVMGCPAVLLVPMPERFLPW
jgi:hypothetical protein